MTMLFGLFLKASVKTEECMIPIYSIDLNIQIFNKFVEINHTHNYKNITESNLDTIFYFPKVLCELFGDFSVKIGKQRYLTQIHKLPNPSEEDFPVNDYYEDSIYLCQIHEYVPDDTILINIGTIPPKSTIEIKFKTIHLSNITNSFIYTFTLPYQFTPSYYADKYTLDIITNILNNTGKDYLDKNKSILTQYLNIRSGKYKIDYYKCVVNIHLKSTKKIASIDINPNLENYFEFIYVNDYETKIIQKDKMTILKDDFILTYKIKKKESKDPNFFIIKHPEYIGDYALYFSYEFPALIKEEFNEIPMNFAIIIDRTKIMSDRRMKKVILSTLFFLKSLPNNSKFIVISFGKKVIPLFEDFIVTDNRNINFAFDNVLNFKADLGNVGDLKNPIQYLYKLITKSHSKECNQIFILTDEAKCNDDIISFVKTFCKQTNTHVNVLCIGNLENTKHLNNNNNDSYQICEDRDDITSKLIKLFEQSIQTCFKNCKIIIEDNKNQIHSQIQPIIHSPFYNTYHFNSNMEYYAILPQISDNTVFKFTADMITNIIQKQIVHKYNLKDYYKGVYESSFLHKIIVSKYKEVNTDLLSITNATTNRKKIYSDLGLKYQILMEGLSLFPSIRDNSNYNLTTKTSSEGYSFSYRTNDQMQMNLNFNYPLTYFIYIKGPKDITLKLQVTENFTIKQIKKLTIERFGIQNKLIYLKFNNNILSDDDTLLKNDITENGCIIEYLLPYETKQKFVINIKLEHKEKKPLEFSTCYKKVLKYSEIIMNASSLLKINTDKYEFYLNKREITMKDSGFISDFSIDYELEIFKCISIKSNEYNIMRTQKVNGMWMLEEDVMSLIGMDHKKFKRFKTKHKDFLESNLPKESDLGLFSIMVISWLRNNCSDNEYQKFKLIVWKSQRSLNYMYEGFYNKEIQERFDMLFKTDNSLC